MSITFEISAGPAAGQKFWLRLNQSLSVGRSQEADYAISADPTVSSLHLRVGCDQQGGWVEDLQSSNGTFVNGQKVVQRTRVSNGDEIRLGDTRLTVRTAASGPSSPAGRLGGPTSAVSGLSGAPGNLSSVPGSPMNAPSGLPSGTRSSDHLGTPARPISEPLRPVTSPLAGEPVGRSADLVAQPTPLATPPPRELRHTAVDPVAPPRSALSSSDRRAAGAVASESSVEVTGALELKALGVGQVAIFPWMNARQESRLTVIYKLTYTVDPSGKVGVAAEQLPLWVADQPESDDPEGPVSMETDMVPYKVRSDIIVVGHVYAPHGRPVTQLEASVRVGNLQHSVSVWGDRYWSLPTLVQMVPRLVGPEPFTKIPLTYRRSFGGFDRSGGAYCAQNLAGVGYINNLSAKSVHQCPLPNFEDPQQPIIQYDSKPQPTGFGTWGRGWLPRLEYARAAMNPPHVPAYEFFNAAAPQLQYPGYLQGSEPVTLKHLTPDGQLSFRLPATPPRVSIVRHAGITGADGATNHHVIRSSSESQVVPRLDTLVMLPDQRQFYLVYRAVFPLRSIDDPDIMSIDVTDPAV